MSEQIGPFQFKRKLGNLGGEQIKGKYIVTLPAKIRSIINAAEHRGFEPKLIL